MTREEVRALRVELAALRREIGELRMALRGDHATPEEVLRRRGISPAKSNPTDGLLFPPRLSSPIRTRLYTLLKKYSFRLFLRDVIAHRDHLTAEALTRFCARETVREYLTFLCVARIVAPAARGRYRLMKKLQSFGPTLEWFVAEVFQREFSSPALWGVRLLDMASGGDYDVLTLVEGDLLYVEVKSSPPKHIDAPEIATFLNRVQELVPNAALFFVDTELRMKDKIVPLFEGELGRRRKSPCITHLVDELFVCDERIFLVNSRPGLVSSLGRCLRYWLGQR